MLLADTLYRVPREPGLRLVHRRGPGHAAIRADGRPLGLQYRTLERNASALSRSSLTCSMIFGT